MKTSIESSYKYVFIAVIFILSLLVVKKTGLSFPITLTSTTVSSELSVVGEGKVDVVPDTLYVDIGSTVIKEQTAELVQNKLTEANNKIIDAVKSLGIDIKDIKTSNYSVNPNYVYDGGKSRTDGYTGNATITVKTKKIDLSGKIIQAATEAGATNVGGTRFSVDSPEKFREEARDKAIANAKEQAQKLASSLGISLGKITNIVEANATQNAPIFYADKAMGLGARESAPAPDIQPGSQTINSTVTLYFEKR